jgi:hypothetical protein
MAHNIDYRVKLWCRGLGEMVVDVREEESMLLCSDGWEKHKDKARREESSFAHVKKRVCTSLSSCILLLARRLSPLVQALHIKETQETET